ncbi:hypothetical protein BG005_001599 [Podila minutissima]|nr:hypothetical protein BG005_001599 [Podila minutissima]
MSNRINFGFADRQRREKSAVPTPSSTESLLHDLLLIAPDASGLFDPQAEIHPQSSPIYQEVMRESLELQQYKQHLKSELEKVGLCEAQLHEWCQSHGYPYPTYHTYPQQYPQEQQQHQHQQQQQHQPQQPHPQGLPADVPAYWSDKEVEDLFRGAMAESTSFVVAQPQPQPEQATQARVSPPTIAHAHLHPSDAFVVQSIAPHLLNNQPPPGTGNDSKVSPWTPDSSPPILPYSYPHTHAHSHGDTMAQPSSPSEVLSKHSPNLKQNAALPSVPTLQLQTLSTKAPHSPLSPPLTPTSSSSLPPTPQKAHASSNSSFSSSSSPRASPSSSTRKPKMSPSLKSCSPRSTPYQKPTDAAPSSPDIKPIKKHICEINNCGKVFTRASNLRTHETTHSKVKPFPCVHPGCESKFARVHDMKRHLRNHTKDFPYACVICEDKRFVRNDPLWRHYHHDHKDDPRVPARKRKIPAGEVDRVTFVEYIKTEEGDVEMENDDDEVDDEDTDAEAEGI